jgi:hypothetical protein
MGGCFTRREFDVQQRALAGSRLARVRKAEYDCERVEVMRDITCLMIPQYSITKARLALRRKKAIDTTDLILSIAE